MNIKGEAGARCEQKKKLKRKEKKKEKMMNSKGETGARCEQPPRMCRTLLWRGSSTFKTVENILWNTMYVAPMNFWLFFVVFDDSADFADTVDFADISWLG